MSGFGETCKDMRGSGLPWMGGLRLRLCTWSLAELVPLGDSLGPLLGLSLGPWLDPCLALPLGPCCALPLGPGLCGAFPLETCGPGWALPLGLVGPFPWACGGPFPGGHLLGPSLKPLSGHSLGHLLGPSLRWEAVQGAKNDRSRKSWGPPKAPGYWATG